MAMESIRESIVKGDFEPGQRLNERELSAAMGISTTPIKEALRLLEQMGFVKTRPRKGTFVSDVVNSSLSEIFMIRANLEGLAARFAATKITPECTHTLKTLLAEMKELAAEGNAEKLEPLNTSFHAAIHEFAENPMLTQALANILSMDRAFRKRALQYQGELELGFFEHQGIGDAVCSGNAEFAELRMRSHILRTAEKVLHHMEKSHP